jgi:hypothetical protein
MGKSKIISICLLFIFSCIGAFSTNPVKREKIKHTCESQLGVRELTGNNDGVMVETYLRSVKRRKGDAWCAAFVSWVYQQCEIENPRSGWSPDWFPKGKTIRRLSNPVINLSAPQMGDVYGIYFNSHKRIAHVGIIIEWSEKYAITIEGNTNEAGSREGDGVYKKKRLKRQVYEVSSWV